MSRASASPVAPGPGLGRPARPRAALAAAALVGAALAAWVGLRTYRDAREVERLRFEAAAETHLGLIRDHLGTRETLARAVAATFHPPPGRIAPAALAALDPRFLALVPDITSFVWAPRVEPAEVPAALAALAQAGVPHPAILGQGRAPLAAPPAGRPMFPVLDIEPRTATNLSTLGLDLAALPLPSAALAAAEARRDAAATAPLELVQYPGEKAFVLYVPVFGPGAGPEARPAGYLGFSYRFARLFGSALGPATIGQLRVAASDAEAPRDGVLFRAGPAEAPPGVAPLRREIEFGGRTWTADYWPAEDPRAAARARALATGGTAALGIAAVIGVAAYLAALLARLEAAMAGRAAAEARLRAVADELNHRTKNILAVVQAVVARSLPGEGGGDPAALRQALIGRLRAMAGATELLARSEWQAVRLPEVLASSGLPFAERVRLERGADLLLAPGAAQHVVLLVHELWTNAAKHGALSVEDGRVRLDAAVEGGTFRLAWAEEGGPPAALPERRGFGRQLIERIVPVGLGGAATLTAGPDGLRYALEAPAARVVEAARPAGGTQGAGAGSPAAAAAAAGAVA